MKKYLLPLIAIMGSTLFALLLIEIGLRFFPVRSYLPIAPVTIEDPVVHFEPHVEQTYSAGWDFDAYNVSRANAQGYLSDFDFEKDGKLPLIGVVGDSFVEARMVPFEKTLQERIRHVLQGTHRVYAMGVGGSPLSQYLAFAAKLRDDYKPEFLIVNIVENDFDESFPAYKNMPRFHYFIPMRNGTYRPLLIDQYKPSLIKESLSHLALVRYLYFHLDFGDVVNKVLFRKRGGTTSDMGAEEAANMRKGYAHKAVDSFLDLITAYSGLDKDHIVLVVDGMRNLIYDGTYDDDKVAQSYFGDARHYLIQQARSNGFEIIDLQPAFKADYKLNGNRFDYKRDAHWNEIGHGVAAGEILKSKNLQRYLKRR